MSVAVFLAGTRSLLVLCGVIVCRKGFMEDIHDNASDSLKVVARKRKGEKIQKRNVQSGDGAKYMSYIKVIHLIFLRFYI